MLSPIENNSQMEKTVFSSKFHWGYKLLLRASLSGSRWPTQKELDALFGDYLSHNVWSGHFFFSLTGPLYMYHGFWFVSLWDSCVFEYMCFCFYMCFLYFLWLFSLFVYLVRFQFVGFCFIVLFSFRCLLSFLDDF